MNWKKSINKLFGPVLYLEFVTRDREEPVSGFELGTSRTRRRSTKNVVAIFSLHAVVPEVDNMQEVCKTVIP
jgi:hypothetical protein